MHTPPLAAGPARCAGCGDPLELGQWNLDFLKSGSGYHYDCFFDPVDAEEDAPAAKDGKLRAIRKQRRVLATLPAADLASLLARLEDARRQHSAE